MTQKGGWKLTKTGEESPVITAINSYLDKITDWLLKRPPLVDRIAAATKREEARAVELRRILLARRELDAAKKGNRDLERDIKAIGKPQPKAPNKITMGGTRR